MENQKIWKKSLRCVQTKQRKHFRIHKKTLKNMTSFFQTRHSIELLTTASEPMNISLYYWNCYLLVKWKVFYDQNKTILMPFSTFIGLAS